MGDITEWGVDDWWGVGSGLIDLLFLKVIHPVACHFTLLPVWEFANNFSCFYPSRGGFFGMVDVLIPDSYG